MAKEKKVFTLEDLTKEQLIILIREQRWPLPTSSDMAYAIWLDMTNRAQALLKKGIDKGIDEPTPAIAPDATLEQQLEYLDAVAKQNEPVVKSLKLHEKADAFWKEHLEAS